MAEAGIIERRTVTLRRARAGDNAPIAAIWNDAVTSPSLTTDEPRTPGGQRAWLGRHGDDHPVIVAAEGDEVLAYGNLSAYRDKPAFRTTVEDSEHARWLDIAIMQCSANPNFRGSGSGAPIVQGELREVSTQSW